MVGKTSVGLAGIVVGVLVGRRFGAVAVGVLILPLIVHAVITKINMNAYIFFIIFPLYFSPSYESIP